MKMTFVVLLVKEKQKVRHEMTLNPWLQQQGQCSVFLNNTVLLATVHFTGFLFHNPIFIPAGATDEQKVYGRRRISGLYGWH